jgi:heme/copper-type cytochrome/quinol oxidase subunit 4
MSHHETHASADHSISPQDAAQFRRQALRNGLIGLVLAIGASITVALSYVDLGSTRAHVVAALGIALLQAGVVSYISMHLKGEKETIVKPLIITGIFLIALLGLSLLGFTDRAHY